MNEPQGGGSASPQPIQTHKAREGEIEPAAENAETVEAVERHLSRHVGKGTFVFHEIVSDIVHLDIHLVPPSADRPYHTLMTSGMSDRPDPESRFETAAARRPQPATTVSALADCGRLPPF